MIAGANDISSGAVGLVYFCAVFPALLVKLSAPYWQVTFFPLLSAAFYYIFQVLDWKMPLLQPHVKLRQAD